MRRFRNYVYNEAAALPEQEEDNAKALKDLLLDIECLDPLSEWTSKFNLFDILKITRTEIRHSNMLSWLLNPNENHGLGDSIIRGFIHYVVTSFSEAADVFDTLLMDCHDFVIQREWRNIDVLAVSIDEKFVLCIENKIDSAEHDDQLNRYRKIVEEVYPDYKKMYIFLSPEGTESSDPEFWCSMSYQNVLGIIENARKKVKLLPDAALLIDNYVETIRRDIVGDEKLAQICAEIYAKHQKALDLIFENRPDRASDLGDIIKAWATAKTEKVRLRLRPKSVPKHTYALKPLICPLLCRIRRNQIVAGIPEIIISMKFGILMEKSILYSFPLVQEICRMIRGKLAIKLMNIFRPECRRKTGNGAFLL